MMNSSYFGSLTPFYVCGQLDFADSDAYAAVLTIPGVPNVAWINRIIVTATDLATASSNKLDIWGISDIGKYLAAEAAVTGSGEQYVLFAVNEQASATGPNTFWKWDNAFDPPLQWQDDLETNCFHLLLSSPDGLSAATNFRVEVYGNAAPRVWMGTGADINPETARVETHPQVWRWGVGNFWRNWTESAQDWNGDAQFAFNPLSVASDYLYVGMTQPWDGLWFMTQTPNIHAGVTATWQYSQGGNSWSSLTVLDNCSNGVSSGIPFLYPGVIEWVPPTDWATDDLSALAWPQERPGLTDIGPLAYDTTRTPRYWIRLNLSSLLTNPSFRWIIRKPRVVGRWGEAPRIFASSSPSMSPSSSPSASYSPSASPSNSPSISPSASPSVSPSISPSVSPSVSPSISPSHSPSVSPSVSPSASPSVSPSASYSPSKSPSMSPSASYSPSASPSSSPSKSPSASPSKSPSASPSASPSSSPSASPSASPSQAP